MSRFLNFLTNSPAAVVLLVAALLGVVVFAVPVWHEWAWIVGLVLVLGLAVGLLLMYGQYEQLQARIDALNAELAGERENVRSVTAELSEYKPMTDDDSDDTRMAKRIVGTLPTGEGLLPWLRVTTQLTAWDQEMLSPLTTFLEENRRTSFEDAKVHPAFMDLYRAGQQLADWFTLQGSPRADSTTIDLTPGDQREGGWRAYGEARTQGESLAEEFLAARAVFVRVGLETGTLPTR